MTRSRNIDTAKAFLAGLASSDIDPVIGAVSPDRFVQHDPAIADGVAGLRAQARQAPANPRLEIARALEDGSFVVLHGRTGIDTEGEVFFAVFRFDEGIIVEHWRFATPAAPPNESGHTQIDGPTEPDASHDTANAKAIVRDYYETVHVGRQHAAIARYMAGDRKVRHEPGVRDGVAAFTRDLAVLTRSRTIDAIVLLRGQGDFVFLAARGTHEGDPCAYIDLYRVEAGKLVEHWGFSQAIPPAAASNNANGLL